MLKLKVLLLLFIVINYAIACSVCCSKPYCFNAALCGCPKKGGKLNKNIKSFLNN